MRSREKEITGFRFSMPRRRISYPEEDARWQLQRVAQTLHELASMVSGRRRIVEKYSRERSIHRRRTNVPAVIVVYPAACLLLLRGFEETESFRDSRTPLYVENPPLCQRPVGRHSPVTRRFRVFPHTAAHANPRNVRTCQIIIKTPHARARARARGFASASENICHRIYCCDDYLTVSYVQNLLFAHLDPHLTRFLSLSLFVRNKGRCLSAN